MCPNGYTKAFYKMLIHPPYCFTNANNPDAVMTLTISVYMCVVVWFFRSTSCADLGNPQKHCTKAKTKTTCTTQSEHERHPRPYDASRPSQVMNIM